jgi:multidrug efflux pump subunit AcrB
VRVNALADSVAGLNRLPLKQVGGTTVYLSDVAHVRDGWALQQNIVHAEGKRAVLLTIIKNGDASTLDVVNRVKAALPEIQKAAPPGLDIKLLFDQSVFVQNSIDSVLRKVLSPPG